MKTESKSAPKTAPDHLAIILDGNGRWAKRRGLPRLMGHRAGLRKLEEMVRLVKRRGIRYFSVYAFSTENWNRPKMEVDGLMSLFRYYIRRKVDAIRAEGGRIRFAGRRDNIPADLLEMMRWVEERTKEETTIDFILCLNYGGRAEVLDAVNADVPDPDLIVRTSGELRLSNFWLWEAAYSEFYFTDIHWPDFDEAALDAALENYAGRERRYGGLKS